MQSCPNAYHVKCLVVGEYYTQDEMDADESEPWRCPVCVDNQLRQVELDMQEISEKAGDKGGKLESACAQAMLINATVFPHLAFT